MQILQLPLLALLLHCYVSDGQANLHYVHPFHLFATEKVCQTLQVEKPKPLQTLPVASLDINILTPDSRDQLNLESQKPSSTEEALALAELLNSVGLKMYQALSRKQKGTNTLFSPVNTYGSLVNFYLGASRRTASYFQLRLGLSSGTDPEDCVSLVDGHKVLKTLQSLNSLDDEPKDEFITKVWAFTRRDAQLSEDFIQGTQDFSDSSFTRGVDFSKAEEAEQLVNSFVEKTSDGKVKNVFKDLNSNTKLLFLSSFNFKGSWMTAFQPEKTSLQEFHVDETTTVMAPLMTNTGRYLYLKDEVRRCTVLTLSLSLRSYILLVLPHEGAKLHGIESKVLSKIISNWTQSLQDVLLELSLPKFSMSSVTDVRDLLTTVDPEVETMLLGSQAEFSRLGNIQPFTVDKVVNKALFEMSGKGAAIPQDMTEGAAIPQDMTEGAAVPQDMTEGAAVPQDMTEGAAVPQDMTEGAAVPQDMTEGAAVPQDMTEGAAVPQDMTEGAAVPQDMTEGAAVPQDMMEGAAVPQDMTEGAAVPQDMTEGAAVPQDMTEGAAVPQDMTESAAPQKLSFNRPFFFAVIEGNSGAILLLGKITNPTL